MEQTASPSKPAAIGPKIILVVGTVLLLGLFIIMAINMVDFESQDLASQKAPEFTLTLFDQFEQDEMVLTNLQGKVVVLNFWASWCVECYKEAALLEQAWQDYQDKDVIFLGVDHLDTEKEALAYLQQYGVTYPNGPDLGDKISQNYHITGVPETFFIDQEGNIAHVQIGPIGESQLYDLLDSLIE